MKYLNDFCGYMWIVYLSYHEKAIENWRNKHEKAEMACLNRNEKADIEITNGVKWGVFACLNNVNWTIEKYINSNLPSDKTSIIPIYAPNTWQIRENMI